MSHTISVEEVTVTLNIMKFSRNILERSTLITSAYRLTPFWANDEVGRVLHSNATQKRPLIQRYHVIANSNLDCIGKENLSWSHLLSNSEPIPDFIYKKSNWVECKKGYEYGFQETNTYS